MKHTDFFKRLMSVLLVAVLMVSNVLPAMATHTHEENSSGTNISFTRVDNSEVSAGLIPNGEAEITQEEEYAATEVVRVSIILKKASTIDAGYSTMSIASNQDAMEYRDSLMQDQANTIQSIERTIGSELDVVWNLTLAANLISANVQYGQIEAIEKLPGVKCVILENQYEAHKVEALPTITNMATSGAQIGSAEAWEAGYTGAGMRIAVIDTGTDTNHQSLNDVAFEYALAQLAAKKNMSVEDYMESLDLLDAEEIASVASRLNVQIDAETAYLTSKLPFAYNYKDSDYDVTHDNDEQGGHGSHVAGIATANSWLYSSASGNYGKATDYCMMQGVAPEAQLLTMKVFGKAGGPHDSDYMAAIEDAIILGADVLNLSLGSTAPGRGTHNNPEIQQILDSLSESGVVVTISAGNAGPWVEFAENGGYLYSTDTGMNTTSQPGSFTNSLCVASVENDGMVGYYISIDGKMFVYNEDTRDGDFSNQPFTTIAGEHEYIFIDGIGDEDDWKAVKDVLPGKIALCSRGEINFSEKANLAVKYGAAGVFVYNNQSGVINLDLSDYEGTQPVAAITKKQGEQIRALSTPVNGSDGKELYRTGTMTISSGIGMGYFGSDYYTMSDFSSWGVPGSLEMKPEITAPGGNIWSLDGEHPSGGSYAIMSGTSMAAPQVAGMSALLIQYIREMGLDEKTGMSVRHLAQSLLMSTARPIKENADIYFPILQQGAGLANVNDAMNADSIIIMGADTNSGAADGKVKVELFDDPDRTGSYSATFTIYNLTDVEKDITLGADFFVQSVISDGEFLYMDYSTAMIGMNVIWTIGGAVVTSDTMDMAGMDFNGDGQVNVADGQHLLDYATGAVNSLENKDKADVDGDGDIDSHDAYVFLSNLSTTTAVLPAGGSVDIRVDFSLPAKVKAQLEESYPNGTYIQGYLFAETETVGEVAGTTHSIPVLGFYGNWTDASMFDVGMWPTYDTGEDTHIPYTGILRGNEFKVRYANNPNYHYTLGGNPVITDATYHPERNAINSSDAFHGIKFIPIRHANQSRILVVNETTGKVIMDRETGPVNMSYYPNQIYGWQNTNMILETPGLSLKETTEGDVISVAFSLAPEYYVDRNGNVDWDAMGAGATMAMDIVIDNTAPELKSVSVDVLNNTMTIVASDNQYVAAAGLYNKTGTRRLASTGSKEDIKPGEEATYTFSLEGINGKKFLVQVHDYAMNTATYLIEMQIGENAGIPDIMAFDLVQYHWTTFDNTFSYDYKVGTPRLAYADFTYYAATIAEHYVFASTNYGDLYVMPEDDLSDTTFIVDMGVVLYDMAYNKDDGNIYGVTEANNLVVIDKLSGEVTRIGAMPKKTNTLACSPDGVFYFNELGTGKIWSFTLDDENNISEPVLLMEDPYLTRKDEVYGDHNGTEGNMGMEYDPNRNLICWNSHLEVLFGSYITFAYYYEIDPATGDFTRYNDFWHEMSCLMVPDETGRNNNWAEPTDEVSDVLLNKSSVEIIKGTSTSLTANVKPWTATNRNVTWSSSDETVAVVDQNGVITGLKEGTATITATSELDPSKSATCQVTVKLLEATINGTLVDSENNPMTFSWDLAHAETWTPGIALPVAMTSATYSTVEDVYYMMDYTEALQMHKVNHNGQLIASADNENGIPLWDMVYSEVFSAPDAEKVTSIYYSYLLSAKDPMALDAVGFDLGMMCSYLLGITSMGYERVADEEGNYHDTEHLIMLDAEGYIWDFWVYAREGGGFDALFDITQTNLNVELPGYDSMEHMFASLMADENGNLYLAAFTGETSELYYMAYDETEEQYLAVKIGDMGKDVYPATITSVTLNSGNTTNATSPAPKYTMSSKPISQAELAAASTKVPFTVTEAEKNFKLGVRTQDDHIAAQAAGDTADTPIELAVETKTYELATNAGAYFKFTAPSAGKYNITITPEDDATYLVRRENHPETTAIWDTQPGEVELAAGQSVIYRIRLYKETSRFTYYAGNVIITVAESGSETPCEHTNKGEWVTTDDNEHWRVCADCDQPVDQAAHNYGAWSAGKKTCDTCGKEIVCQHTNKSEFVTDEANHWKTCTDCGEKVDEAPHDFTNGDCVCGIEGNADGTEASPIELVEGNNTGIAPTTGNDKFCYFSYTATEAGTVTVSSEGTAWRAKYFIYDSSNELDNTQSSGSAMHNPAYDGTTITKTLEAGGKFVIKISPYASGSYGGEITVNFHFEAAGSDTPCEHTNKGEWVTTDDNEHWRVCADCDQPVDQAVHNYGAWSAGKKTCDTCGKEIVCQHTNKSEFVTDEANHWKTCTDCGEKVDEAPHDFTNGDCVCGKEAPSGGETPEPPVVPENPLILGNNNLVSGTTYGYVPTEDGAVELYIELKDSTGTRVYQYAYGKHHKVEIMVNGKYLAQLEDSKVTVKAGELMTVEVVSKDGTNYTAKLTMTATEAPVALQLGTNSLSDKTYYSFIAPQDGTLYTTIQELYFDGSWCTEISLTSNILFRIDGQMVETFFNSYEVKKGEEITVYVSGNRDPASAKFHLSFEGYDIPEKGTRRDPYTLSYAQCPTDSVEIPASTAVWYKLSGFGEGYLTVEGANAYVIIGNSTVPATNGKVTVPASAYLQIGNAGSTPATFRLSGAIEEGTALNPKDMVQGSNSATLGKSENYYYDFVAKKPGKATITVSGDNWSFWFSHLNVDGSFVVEEEEHRENRGDSATVTVDMIVGQSLVIKLGTMDSSWMSTGGTVTVNFQFTPDPSASDCEHVDGTPVRENEIPAKCEEPGSYDTVVYCTECGEELSRVTTPVTQTGHTPGPEAGCTTAQVCTVCGKVLNNHKGHNYVDGVCSRCGADEAESNLVLGVNDLISGNIYTYVPTQDGRIEFDFILKDGSGTQIYQYAYGKHQKVKIMINGKYVPNVENTKVTVIAGQPVTVELVSTDGNNYTAKLTMAATDPAVALVIGDNNITKNTDYSFIATQTGTLYTTIKELWYDGTYCSEASLASTIVFRINGVAVNQFRNSYEVTAGDEITVTIGLSFGSDSAKAILNLSYEDFYYHPAGSRGNPYALSYAQCPIDSAEIPAGSTVWYRLSGFGSGYYLTVTGENAYVIVGNTTYNAQNGAVTIPASTNIQIGNAGTAPATFRLTASITEGYPDNPKDLVEGDNAVSLPARGTYYYDFAATGNTKITFTVSGDNWGYQYTIYAPDGTVLEQPDMLYKYKGDSDSQQIVLGAGQRIVIKLGTMDSSWTQTGGALNINFHSEATDEEVPCYHYGETYEYDDNYHWLVCEACGESFDRAEHSYGGGRCYCGKYESGSGGSDPHRHMPSEWQYDDNGHWQVCATCGDKVNQGAHDFTNGDCVCGKPAPGAGGELPCDHNPGAWNSNDSEHWQICGLCGETVNREVHSYDQDTGLCKCGAADPDHEVNTTVIETVTNEVESNNGVVVITWDPEKMTLVDYQIHADFYSEVKGEGKIVIGYISMSAIPANQAIVTMTFEAVDPNDAEVKITPKEINNTSYCVHANTEVRNKNTGSCTENGYTGDTWCLDCNTMIEEGEPIVADGHNFVDGVCTDCGQHEDGCNHANTEIRNKKPADCVSDGYTGDIWCKDCGTMIDDGEAIPANGSHDGIRMSGFPATCTNGGTTDGIICSKCGTWMVMPANVPALGHDEVVDEAVAATCTAAGKTEGKHCARCNQVTVKQEEIPALGHTETTTAAVEATCTTTGLTEGKICSTCNEILVAQEEIPALGHVEVIDAGKAATCTATGLTEGKHCSTCNEILVAQSEIPAKGHTEVIDPFKAATCGSSGLTEGKHCSTCNKVLVAQEEIPAKGHTEIIDAGRNASCTATGLTDGKHCSVCGQILVEQENIPATGHNYGQWSTVKEATRKEAGLETRTCACGMTEVREIAPLGGTSPVVIAVISVAALSAGAAMMFFLMKKKLI